MYLTINDKHQLTDLLSFSSLIYCPYNKNNKQLRDTSPTYSANDMLALSNEELIEQCLALIHAMMAISAPNIRESLLFILEEKLVVLATRIQ